MIQDEYNRLVEQGAINRATPVAPTAPQPAQSSADLPGPLKYTFEDFLPLLFELLSPKLALTAAPTFTPRNLLEAIQIYENGATRRLYVYVNGTWRYSALT